MTDYKLGENICNPHFKNGCVSRIHGELLKLSIEKEAKKKKSLRKWAKDMHRYFTKKYIQTAGKCIKRCSLLLAIRQMDIKSTRCLCYTAVRMENKNQKTVFLALKRHGCQKTGSLIYCWWKCKIIQSLWKTVCSSFTKWKLIYFVKSEHVSCSVVSNSLRPLDYSPPGFSVHGISKARILGGKPFFLQGIFPTQGSNPGSPALQTDSLLSEPPVWPTISV